MKTKDTFIKRRSRFKPVAKEQDRLTCPCCGYPSLQGDRSYEICLICNWEDDGQDDPKADEVWGGPNGDYSLSEARRNFEQYGTMYSKRYPTDFERETKNSRADRKKRLVKAYENVFAASSTKKRETAWKRVKEIE